MSSGTEAVAVEDLEGLADVEADPELESEIDASAAAQEPIEKSDAVENASYVAPDESGHDFRKRDFACEENVEVHVSDIFSAHMASCSKGAEEETGCGVQRSWRGGGHEAQRQSGSDIVPAVPFLTAVVPKLGYVVGLWNARLRQLSPTDALTVRLKSFYYGTQQPDGAVELAWRLDKTTMCFVACVVPWCSGLLVSQPHRHWMSRQHKWDTTKSFSPIVPDFFDNEKPTSRFSRSAVLVMEMGEGPFVLE